MLAYYFSEYKQADQNMVGPAIAGKTLHIQGCHYGKEP